MYTDVLAKGVGHREFGGWAEFGKHYHIGMEFYDIHFL